MQLEQQNAAGCQSNKHCSPSITQHIKKCMELVERLFNRVQDAIIVKQAPLTLEIV